MKRTACLVLVMACGEVNPNQVDAPAADAPRDGALVDGPAAACDRSKPFAAPTLMSSLNTAEDDNGATLSTDERLILIASRPSSTAPSAIFFATRASTQAAFGTRQPVTELNIGDSFNPSLTADGLTVFYSSNGTGTVGGHDFFMATRPSTTASWSTPVNITNINSTSDNEYSISTTGDGNDLYFQSDRTGTAHTYHAIRAGNSFGPPAQLTEIADAAGEGGVAVRADGLELYFASTRTGTHGGEDMWVARRNNRDEPFGTPQNVTELNTNMSEAPSWISPDGCRIVFMSNRMGGQGKFDLWQSSRPQ